MAVTKFCPRCGHARTEGERFCRSCGAALGTGETKLTPTPVAASAGGEATASLPPVGPAPSTLPPPPSAPSAAAPIATAPPTAAPQAAAPQERPAPGRSVSVKPLPVLGGVLLVVSAFLPWISGAGSANALDIPIQALWDIETVDGPVKLGFALLALGVLGAGLAIIQRSSWLRRLCGSVGVAIVLGFAAQLYRVIDAAGGSPGDVLSAIGVGVYVALAGAVALQFSR